ncbi:MAG: nucleoside 2-deoxyribosyltransferase domain-containing protein, partial [Kiritimatiellae bacterium]|nr:nucleoside 2-deoxyribosyltransferase domain-containing protein [Kiritimatiellia bacterium]
PAPPPPVPPKPGKAAPPPVDCGRGGTMFAPPTPFAEKKGWTVFLAGPIGGAPEWQRSIPKLAEKEGLEGVAWLNPRGKHLPHRPQVEWETHGLRVCDYVLFWVPKQAKPADKPYALTTRMELAENLARGKRVVLGIDPDVPWMRHAKFLAERYGVKKVHGTLEECLRTLKKELAHRKPTEREIDGPAWVAETLARHPACVDDLARNQLLAEQWNREFAPGDVVRVRGSLPVDPSLLPFLNGDIRIDG